MKMKNSWVVVGPEGSGSSLMAKTISYALNHCSYFGQYSGYGFNNKKPCENYILHRSLPNRRPKKFQDTLRSEIREFSDKFEKVNYILTTRDINCSILSKITRFGGNITDAKQDYNKTLPYFEELVDNDNCYIWNYESMILLGRPYFMRMYRFFKIKSDFVPNIYDANSAYIKKHIKKPKTP